MAAETPLVAYGLRRGGQGAQLVYQRRVIENESGRPVRHGHYEPKRFVAIKAAVRGTHGHDRRIGSAQRTRCAGHFTGVIDRIAKGWLQSHLADLWNGAATKAMETDAPGSLPNAVTPAELAIRATVKLFASAVGHSSPRHEAYHRSRRLVLGLVRLTFRAELPIHRSFCEHRGAPKIVTSAALQSSG